MSGIMTLKQRVFIDNLGRSKHSRVTPVYISLHSNPRPLTPSELVKYKKKKAKKLLKEINLTNRKNKIRLK